MSFREAQRWLVYLHKRGSIHLGRRVEASFALLLSTYLRSKGAKEVSMRDFMPHEDNTGSDIADVVRLLGAVPTVR